MFSHFRENLAQKTGDNVFLLFKEQMQVYVKWALQIGAYYKDFRGVILVKPSSLPMWISWTSANPAGTSRT